MIGTFLPDRREALVALLCAFTLVALAREARAAAVPGERRVRRWMAVDPVRARRLGGGSLIAPIVDFAASSRLYTSAI